MIVTRGYGYEDMTVSGDVITVNVTQDSVITFDISEEAIDVTAAAINVSVAINEKDEVTIEVI